MPKVKTFAGLGQSVIDLMKLKFGVDFERGFEIGSVRRSRA